MKIFYSIAGVTLFCITCYGQSYYKGLTPGQSTRADVGRVLGQPVKDVSKTLIEYKSPEAESKLFVQYRDESPGAIVERIERTCFDDDEIHDKCGPVLDLKRLEGVLADVFTNIVKPPNPGFIRYYGAPRFIVETLIAKGTNPDERLAFYSKELYESVVPKSGCTGTIFGTWETDRGRMTVKRIGDNGVQGSYSKNKGSFSLWVVDGGYQGTWNDNTGTGEMALLHDRDTFSATWTGPGAKVPPKETPKPSTIGAALGSTIGAIVGSSTEPSMRYGVLPPGERWKGKCVP